jgi:uncharacterized protein
MKSDAEGLHESPAVVGPEAMDAHRALRSLQEELEAVDWYHQRAHASTDPELRRILEHHRDEEIEHACMIVEWLRRRMPQWDDHLKTYLFTEASIVDIEHAAGHAAPEAPRPPAQPGSLGLHARRAHRS